MPEFRVNTIEEIDNVRSLPGLLISSCMTRDALPSPSLITQAHKILQETFRTGTTRPLSWRKHQLNQVVLMLRENVEAIVQAFSVDLLKPRHEVLGGEIGTIVHRATQSIALLDEWACDESVPAPDWQKSWSPTILKRPRGVVLVVSCVSIVSSSPLFHLCDTCVKDPGITLLLSACSHSSAP